MARFRLPIPVALSMPAAVLVGHAVGYAPAGAGPPSAEAHAHLPVTAALASVSAAAALLLALRRRSSPGGLPTPVARLAALQVTAFLVLELVEHAATGHGVAPLAASPAVWLGVPAQVAVAVAIRHVLQTVGELALPHPFPPGPATLLHHVGDAGAPPLLRPAPVPRVGPVGPRGPPHS